MSQYTCRLYRNSGFNAVNIPDSPALLDTIGNYVDCYAIELNQERFLPSVRIRGDWLSCRDADYCKVGDFFYFVNSVTMLSGDVAELSLTPDFITSAGGPAALEILDGVTDRVHVTDDTFGIYGADDPFMAPALDLDIESWTKDFYDTGANYYTFLETTLDLGNMGSKSENDVVEALTCKDLNITDPDTGENPYVVVPVVDHLIGNTEYDLNLFGTTKPLTAVEGQGVYMIDDTTACATIKKGIALARSLGVEESISGQYSIPVEFVSPTMGSVATKFATKITGRSFNFTAPLNFVYDTAVNNRVFYGSFTPYYLATGAGSTVSVLAEEIYGGSPLPNIVVLADPRRGGKPYFRFNPLNGETVGTDPLDFFRGAVSGKEWQSVPMVMNTKSGGLLDYVKYKNSRNAAAMEWAHAEENNDWAYKNLAVNTAMSGGKEFISGIGNVKGGRIGSAIGNVGDMLSTAVGATMSALGQQMKFNQYIDQYNYQRALDMQELKISMNVHTPDVNFPLDPNLFSELTGNGVTVARAKYKAADIRRIDKILTAYGYKYSKLLEASDFSNRTYFNYVSGSISVGNLPGWWANGIAAQINNGVRVWHVKPNHTYYASNPVVTPTV